MEVHCILNIRWFVGGWSPFAVVVDVVVRFMYIRLVKKQYNVNCITDVDIRYIYFIVQFDY